MNQSAKPSRTTRRKRATSVAIACGLLLVLPSCGIPELRKPVPVAPLTGTFMGGTGEENSSALRVEEFFNDPKLLGLIEQAVTGNLEQKIIAQDAQIAANEVHARRGAYLPLLSAGAGAGLNKASTFSLEGAGLRDDPFRPGQFLPNPYGNFALGANLTWQVDVWRQLRNGRDAAAMRFLSTNERRNYFVTRLVADVAENYYELIMLDKRIEILNQNIALFEQSLRAAQLKRDAARGTELDVQRFQAEVRRNQSEKLIVNQQIIEVENRINFLVGRFPQPVDRMKGDFIDLRLPPLNLGVPAQLLRNRPDVRQSERELTSAGLDIKVAKANFFPKFFINGGVGYQAFDAKYLLITPEALVYNVASDLVAPLVNKRAIQAEFVSANSRQLQALYNYQRTLLNAFTEVINRMNKVENYTRSIELKRQQVASLEFSVSLATQLYPGGPRPITWTRPLRPAGRSGMPGWPWSRPSSSSSPPSWTPIRPSAAAICCRCSILTCRRHSARGSPSSISGGRTGWRNGSRDRSRRRCRRRRRRAGLPCRSRRRSPRGREGLPCRARRRPGKRPPNRFHRRRRSGVRSSLLRRSRRREVRTRSRPRREAGSRPQRSPGWRSSGPSLGY